MNKSTEVGPETISLLKSGNRPAFDEIYQHYSSNLYLRILKMVKVQEVADELLQDIFLKVWLKRDLIDENQPFKAWIYKIAQNCIYDHYRLMAKDAKMRQYLIDHYSELYNETEEYLLNKERRAVLNLALDRLPEKRKQIFMLCRIEGKSYEEAASILNISPSTVSNQLVKATKSMRDYVFFHSKEFMIFAIALHLSK